METRPISANRLDLSSKRSVQLYRAATAGSATGCDLSQTPYGPHEPHFRLVGLGHELEVWLGEYPIVTQ